MVKLMDIKEAAEILGISSQKLYQMAKLKEVPAKKIGGRWKLHPERLKEWIDRQFDVPDKGAQQRKFGKRATLKNLDV